MSNLLDKIGSATSGVWKVIKTIVGVLLLLIIIIFFYSMYQTDKIIDDMSDNLKIKSEQTLSQAKDSGTAHTAPPAASLHLLAIERVNNSLGDLSHAILRIKVVNQTGKVIKGMKLRFTVYDQFGDLVQTFTYKLEKRIEPTNGKIVATGIDLNQFIEQDQRLSKLKDFKSSVEILDMVTE